MTELEFAECLVALQAGLGREFPAHQQAVWYECLKDLSSDQLRRGVAQWLQTVDSGFPSIAAIRKLSLGGQAAMDAETRAVAAWEAFKRSVGTIGQYASVDFDDPMINATVLTLGGWERVCNLEGDAFYVWLRKDFERTYSALCRMGITAEMARPLLGFCDRENAGMNWPNAEPEVRRIETGLPPHAIPALRDDRTDAKRLTDRTAVNV